MEIQTWFCESLEYEPGLIFFKTNFEHDLAEDIKFEPGLIFFRRQMTSKLILKLADGVLTARTAAISAWLMEDMLSRADSSTELTSLKVPIVIFH
jgi:hypothetical protein